MPDMEANLLNTDPERISILHRRCNWMQGLEGELDTIHAAFLHWGADKPALYQDDAPVLSDAAMKEAEDQGFYLVGLIGGKEVGKSALVNALVGKSITQSTSFGEGTQIGVIRDGVKHPGRRAVLGDTLSPEIGEMCPNRTGSAEALSHDAGLYDHPARTITV